jgi:hypothetical protein
MLAWLSRFLDQRWNKVKYGETFPKYTQTKVGLPQGAVTSTTIFNIYINDLPNTVRNTKIKPLAPSDPYMGRTAQLTSRRCILNAYSINICTEYFKCAA